MDVQVLGIDLGKNSCSLVGLDASGRVVVRRRMRRESIAAFAAKAPGCIVAMEACCGVLRSTVDRDTPQADGIRRWGA